MTPAEQQAIDRLTEDAERDNYDVHLSCTVVNRADLRTLLSLLRPVASVEALAAVEEERANAARLTAVLERAREYVAAAAAPEESYGAGAGCDPREFTPDPECSTEEERARHAADCEKAVRGEPIDTLTGCHVEGAALVNYQGWGLGTYVYHDEEAGRALADLDDALAAHRARRGRK